MTVCGLFVILLTIVIGAFLVYKGSSTFLVYRHSFLKFLRQRTGRQPDRQHPPAA